MVSYNQEVLVKTKRWHKIHTQGMASPYFAAKVKGPSPLMHNGWDRPRQGGKIQHVRTVLIPDPLADEAHFRVRGGETWPISQDRGETATRGSASSPVSKADEERVQAGGCDARGLSLATARCRP